MGCVASGIAEAKTGVSDPSEKKRDILDRARSLIGAGGRDAIPEGLRLIDEAARDGSGEALAMQSHFHAMGWTGQPDWDRSIALLIQAAEKGWMRAHEELRVLCGGTDASPAQMARKIDLGALVAPRSMDSVSSSPLIWTAPAFMSVHECRWMIEAAAPRLATVKVYDRAREGTHEVAGRSNTGAEFTRLYVDLVLLALQTRISNTVGVPVSFFETTTVLHYSVGQEFVRHVDYIEPTQPGATEEIAARGQRIGTFLVYLNDGYEGGETDFPRLLFRYRGAPGDGLTFSNTQPDASPDPRTLHAGLPPTSGEKWLLSQWIRNRHQKDGGPGSN